MSSCTALCFLAAIGLTLGLAGCPSRPDDRALAPDAAVPTTMQIIAPNADATSPGAGGPEPGPTDTNVPDTVLGLDGGPDTTRDARVDAVDATSASALGLACHLDTDCISGSCVDGVCCSASSCGACSSCAVAGSLGTCAPIPKFTEDPKSNCTDTNVCDGIGNCASTTATTAPGAPIMPLVSASTACAVRAPAISSATPATPPFSFAACASGLAVPDCGHVCTTVGFGGSYLSTLYTQACH
jgi:hypothetical protein